VIEAVSTRLAAGRGGEWEVTLFELRLEARGRGEALRLTAAEMEGAREHRWRLAQGLLYPALLSLFLAGALVTLRLTVGGSSLGPEAVPPGRYFAMVAASVALAAAFPFLVWLLTRRPRLPGRRELLLLLQESLLLAPSLGSAIRLLRRALLGHGLSWEGLDRSEALLLEGAVLERALQILSPPLAVDDLALLSSRPERTAAISAVGSLISYGELRRHSFRERQAELLPAAALILVGALLLLTVMAVVLPIFESLLAGALR
jgi:hypothetical protein